LLAGLDKSQAKDVEVVGSIPKGGHEMGISGSKVVLIFVAAIAVLAFCAAPAWAQNPAESLYKTKCAMCHGPDGHGDTPTGKKMGVHDFASPEVQKQSDEDLSEVVTKGKNKMPSYGKSLKPEQIKSLVADCRQLGKKK
jgi:cytochrome c6